jgi:phage tail sheath protein FI
MPQYLSPGVYVEEVDRGAKPIEGVATAVAAFVGFTEKGPREATLVTSWEQYQSIYGGFVEGAYLPVSVYGWFLNGGQRAYIIRVSPTIVIPQSGTRRASLEITPLLGPGSEEPVTVTVDAQGNGRYKLTAKRGDVTETFENLSSDNKDEQARYVNSIINDAEKGSKLVRVHDASGKRESAEKRAPKTGSYNFSSDDSKSAAELPAPTLKLNPRQGDAPVLEVKPASGVSGAVSVEVAEIAGNEELFKLIIKPAEGDAESFDVSFKKGPQYVETVINGGKTASKLVRVKDLAPDSQEGPSNRRPNAGKHEIHSGSTSASASSKVLATVNDFTGDVLQRTGVEGLEALDDVTIVMMPDLWTLYQSNQIDMKAVQVVQTAMMNHCEKMKYRVAVIDSPPEMTAQQVYNWRMKEANYDSKYAAMYYPWIEVANPSKPGQTMFIPPSGHVAGVWARVDNERGVHKAPANEIIRGVVGLEVNITSAEQAGLNPFGINAIRSFPGRGIRIWGARCLTSDPAWKYLNVRRLFNYVEASIERSTQWIVFEPNDAELWARIRRDISAFLYQVWLQGALFGSTAEEAYFVKCDADTNPQVNIDNGIVTTEIGIAPVKPAEFVVFRIGQIAA